MTKIGTIVNDVVKAAMQDSDITSILDPESTINAYVVWPIGFLAGEYGIPNDATLEERGLWVPVGEFHTGYGGFVMGTLDVNKMVQLKGGLVIAKDLADLANLDYIPNVVKADPYMARPEFKSRR